MEAAESARVRWTPPAALPEADLRRAIETLTVRPVSAQHAGQCLARLTLAFEAGTTKLSDEQTYQRARVWREANGDLGDELWSEATLWCLRHHKFGMPRPAEFRAAVGDRLVERQRRLDRCRKLLALGEKTTPRPRTPQDEEWEERKRENELLRTAPPDVQRGIRMKRLRSTIEILARHGKTDRVAVNQTALDALEQEQREDEARVEEARAEVTARDGHPEDVTARDGHPTRAEAYGEGEPQ